MVIPLGGRPRTQYLPRLARTKSRTLYGKNPFPRLRGKVAEGRKGGYKPSVYPAWQLLTSPVFIPLGSYSRAPCLSRLAATHEPRVYPAWRAQNPEPCTERIPSPACGGRWTQAGRGEYKPSVYPVWLLPANPVFIPLGGRPRNQHLSCLVVSTNTMTLRRKENVETLPATSQKIRSPWLSRLAVAYEPSICPAWRLLQNSVFIPLSARQILNLVRKEFLPLLAGDGAPMKKMLAFFSWEPGKVAEGRKGGIQNQHLSRLAAAREPSVYPAWRLSERQGVLSPPFT